MILYPPPRLRRKGTICLVKNTMRALRFLHVTFDFLGIAQITCLDFQFNLSSAYSLNLDRRGPLSSETYLPSAKSWVTSCIAHSRCSGGESACARRMIPNEIPEFTYSVAIETPIVVTKISIKLNLNIHEHTEHHSTGATVRLSLHLAGEA